MKGDPAIIDALNELLTVELTVINQYFLHARMQRNWGYQALADYERKASIRAMKYAEKLTDRLLFLDGLPNLQRYNKVAVGELVPEQLRLDYAAQLNTVKLLNAHILKARDLSDNGTEDLLTEMLVGEEAHVTWLESQLALMKDLGEPHYLAQQIKDDD